MGAAGTSGVLPWFGSIDEVVGYSADISPGLRAAIESYMLGRTGI